MRKSIGMYYNATMLEFLIYYNKSEKKNCMFERMPNIIKLYKFICKNQNVNRNVTKVNRNVTH